MIAAGKMLNLIKKIKPLYAIAYQLRAQHEARSAFSSPENPPIFIYQMGKVGSITVYRSLKDLPITNPILHLHFLSRDLPKHRETLKRAKINPPAYHIYLGQATRKLLNKHKEFPIKVISLVRDPIAFVISNIFENPYFAEESLLTDTGSIDPQKASKYIDCKLKDTKTFTYIYEWFNRELKSVFGVDVFAEPFPLETGHVAYSKGNVKALVIRLEDLTEKGPQAISEFLGLEDQLILKQGNVRVDSNAKEIYRSVKKGVSLDISLCREIYSSKFVKHFYNEDMINKFISTWTK